MMKLCAIIIVLTFAYCFTEWKESHKKRFFVYVGIVAYFTAGYYIFEHMERDNSIRLIYIMIGIIITSKFLVWNFKDRKRERLALIERADEDENNIFKER